MNVKWIIIYALFFITTILSLTLTIISCQMDKDKTPEVETVITEEVVTENKTPANPAITPTSTNPAITPTPTNPAITPTPTNPAITPTPTNPAITPTPTNPVITPTLGSTILTFGEYELELVEVDSVVINVKNSDSSKDVTITKDTTYNNALNILLLSQDSFYVKPNSILNINSKLNFVGYDGNINGKMYYLDEIQMFWDLENYDENNNLLTLKEYIKSKEFGVQQDTMYLATYKEDIIMARQIIDTVGGVKFIRNYSGNYPIIPEEGTEFYKTYLPAQYLIDKFYNFDIQRNYKTIRFIEDQTISFDFSKNLSKKIKLYEGYIIFEETSPFIGTPMNLSFDQIQDYYNGCLNMNGYFTQTMVFNLKTKNIEIFDIKAHTLSWKDMLNKPIEIDLTIKVDMINDNNHKSMIDEFINYVKERAISKV